MNNPSRLLLILSASLSFCTSVYGEDSKDTEIGATQTKTQAVNLASAFIPTAPINALPSVPVVPGHYSSTTPINVNPPQRVVAPSPQKQVKQPSANTQKAPTKKAAAAKVPAKKDSKAVAAVAKKKAKKVTVPIDPATRIITQAQKDAKQPDKKYVALTFDDGPSEEYTPKVLAILKEHNIHATFCLIGRQVKKYPELVKQIVAEGHKVADHSMNHDERLPYRSEKKIKTEILAEKTLIESIVPEAKVEYYRAPGGVWSYKLRTMVVSWGMKPLGWSVDTKDWQNPGVESIIATAQKQVSNGGVILMHDAGGNRSESVEALKKLIPILEKDGYEFGFPQ
jgi:peptidoglycan/xylan/chitin deacetylase (PgdA/CDA1 family)